MRRYSLLCRSALSNLTTDARKDTWIPCSDGHQEWPAGVEETSRQRKKTADPCSLLRRLLLLMHAEVFAGSARIPARLSERQAV